MSPDGLAEVTFEVDDEDYTPLRRGTEAVVKLGSLSGIANRYVDLQLGPDDGEEIDDGGRIGADDTTRRRGARPGVQHLRRAHARARSRTWWPGRPSRCGAAGRELRRGIHYLNPALSTGARLFGELSRDERLLRRFLVDSSDARDRARRSGAGTCTGVVSNLGATFTRAGRPEGGAGRIGGAAAAVPAPGELHLRGPPGGARRRGPAGGRRQAGGAAARAVPRAGARCSPRDAEPTIRDLSRTIQAPGRRNDLIEAARQLPAAGALGARREARQRRRPARGASPRRPPRCAPPRRRSRSGGRTRPTSWAGSTTSPPRAPTTRSASTPAPGSTSPSSCTARDRSCGQFRRCPGANEEPAPDGSNVLTASEQATLDCDRRAAVGGAVKRAASPRSCSLARRAPAVLALGATDDGDARGQDATRSCSTTPSAWPRAATSRSPGSAPAPRATSRSSGGPRPLARGEGRGHGARLRRPARATRTARSGRSRSSASTSWTASRARRAERIPDGGRVPVAQTSSTIPLDLVNNIVRRPYADRLRIIIGELGAGLAGRPDDLSEVLRRAHPGLRETNADAAGARPPDPDDRALHRATPTRWSGRWRGGGAT